MKSRQNYLAQQKPRHVWQWKSGEVLFGQNWDGYDGATDEHYEITIQTF